MTRARGTKSSGLTIIEVLIALAVIAAAFAGLAALQITNIGITRDARVETDRFSVAADAFETIKRDIELNFAEYAKCSGAEPSGTAFNCSPDETALADEGVAVGGYSVTTAIDASPTVVNGAGNPVGLRGMIEVSLTVDDGDTQTNLRQFVSCVDAQPADASERPSVESPGECAAWIGSS